ncbi:hypothetical protein IU486_19680 [Streptomyces gardneri]|uniref:hypothetical protein n=1 Tax=Nocardia abscessus TaxID=120957 RepID=UPI0018948564|nr:hypothetical protein [Nocardia abscessus]MBF6166956.1 hypothetical protein [Streptomyces gardneri]MBF6475352.1 hypothetical protein [Nocardia abscessus]
MAGAIDEAAVYWLQNGEPFDVDAAVECLTQQTVAALRSAAALDSTVDVDAALRPMLGALCGSSEVQQEFSPIRRRAGGFRHIAGSVLHIALAPPLPGGSKK